MDVVYRIITEGTCMTLCHIKKLNPSKKNIKKLIRLAEITKPLHLDIHIFTFFFLLLCFLVMNIEHPTNTCGLLATQPMNATNHLSTR